MTNTTEPVANRTRSSAEVTHPIDREISTLVQPEVALHQSRISWTDSAVPVTPEEDPYKVFTDLFAGTL